MPDRLFSVPLLAEVYDALDPARSDLDVYVSLLAELGARSVIDVGCGTGTFALMLAAKGLTVVGVDPAEASLDIARGKPGGDQVTWLHADASSLPPLDVDAVTMTGNVAQVFLTDAEWRAALESARQALRPGGHIIFETRDPAAEAWRGWTREQSYRSAALEVGRVENWFEVTDVSPPLVSFRGTFRFSSNGDEHTSDSTLRFRSADEVRTSLLEAGFGEPVLRGAPDRPGLELVFIAPSAARRRGRRAVRNR